MKKFSKFLIVIFTALTVVNCSSSDNDSESSISDDIIVGRWEMKYHKFGNITLNDSDCHRQSYIVWNEDFTAERKTYANNGQGGPCFITGEGSGTWRIIPEDESESDDNYEFSDGTTTVQEEIIFLDSDNMYIDYGNIEFHYERVN